MRQATVERWVCAQRWFDLQACAVTYPEQAPRAEALARKCFERIAATVEPVMRQPGRGWSIPVSRPLPQPEPRELSCVRFRRRLHGRWSKWVTIERLACVDPVLDPHDMTGRTPPVSVPRIMGCDLTDAQDYLRASLAAVGDYLRGILYTGDASRVEAEMAHVLMR